VMLELMLTVAAVASCVASAPAAVTIRTMAQIPLSVRLLLCRIVSRILDWAAVTVHGAG